MAGFGRTCLYHRDAPEGRIFTEESECLAALKDGWVEAPWLVDEAIEVSIEVPEPETKAPIEKKPPKRKTIPKKKKVSKPRKPRGIKDSP